MTILHAANPVNSEYTLCGYAFDVITSGDDYLGKETEGDLEIANDHQIVTCRDCIDAIKEIRKIKFKSV